MRWKHIWHMILLKDAKSIWHLFMHRFVFHPFSFLSLNLLLPQFVLPLKSTSWRVWCNLLSIYQCCLHLLPTYFNLGQWFLWILLLMHKHIFKDFCQYQGKLIGIFLIPLLSWTYLYHRSNSLTQTIEYNLCPIYLMPLLCSH